MPGVFNADTKCSVCLQKFVDHEPSHQDFTAPDREGRCHSVQCQKDLERKNEEQALARLVRSVDSDAWEKHADQLLALLNSDKSLYVDLVSSLIQDDEECEAKKGYREWFGKQTIDLAWPYRALSLQDTQQCLGAHRVPTELVKSLGAMCFTYAITLSDVFSFTDIESYNRFCVDIEKPASGTVNRMNAALDELVGDAYRTYQKLPGSKDTIIPRLVMLSTNTKWTHITHTTKLEPLNERSGEIDIHTSTQQLQWYVVVHCAPPLDELRQDLNCVSDLAKFTPDSIHHNVYPKRAHCARRFLNCLRDVMHEEMHTSKEPVRLRTGLKAKTQGVLDDPMLVVNLLTGQSLRTPDSVTQDWSMYCGTAFHESEAGGSLVIPATAIRASCNSVIVADTATCNAHMISPYDRRVFHYHRPDADSEWGIKECRLLGSVSYT